MIKHQNKKRLGFTLVELLVVIAIIGILSSVAIVNLNSAKNEAKIAAAEMQLNSLLNIAILCLENDGNLNCDGAVCDGDIPSAGTNFCTNNNENIWPDLSENQWSWYDAKSDDSSKKFCYTSRNNQLNINYRCKESGCYEITGFLPMDFECNGV